MRTKAQLAKDFYEAFERGTHAKPNEYGDDHYYKLKIGSPEWMRDAIRVAHRTYDLFPDDWLYDNIHSIVGDMTDTDPDDWEDRSGEWADGCVDVYNADRARWLAASLNHAGIVDEAVEELGASDQGIHGNIGIGQYHLLCAVISVLILAIEEQVKEDEYEE